MVRLWRVPAADARCFNMKLKVVFESEKIRDVYMQGEKKFAWTLGNSAIDLRSVEETFDLQPGETRLISSGVRLQIDGDQDSYTWDIRSRSGFAAKGILCHYGTIDYTYTGIGKVCLTNLSNAPFKIEFGDRIAQFVILPIEKPEIEFVEKLDETDRGDKGFGASGVK